MPEVHPTAKAPSPKRSGVVVPHPLRWHQRLAAILLYSLVRMVSATIRYEWQDRTGTLSRDMGRPVIFCVWHNRLALCLEVYRFYLNSIGRHCHMAAMVSASKDGGLLARVLEHYNVQPVRGSSSRRGRQALLEMITWADRGYDLAITPDGPRGPRYTVQDGVISLAQLTGLPIVPVTYHLAWKIPVRSWDRFQIPLPFTKCVMQLAEPFHVPRGATEAEREEVRRRLENCLRDLTVD